LVPRGKILLTIPGNIPQLASLEKLLPTPILRQKAVTNLHRPHRPWPRAPRFWGPVQFLPMTNQY